MKKSKIFSVGLAMFAMLFGAGNVIWPMILGRDVGSKVWFGLLGFMLIGVIVPLMGLISAMLCDGDYKKLLNQLGTVPSTLIIMLCMIVIGPFMGIPRCITLSHASIKLYLPQFTLFFYSLFSVAVIFVCTMRKNKVMDLLGYVLGPIKLTLLLIIVFKGLLSPGTFPHVGVSSWQSFMQGVLNGSYTGDLLGTIFFAGLIYADLKKSMGTDFNYKKLAIAGLQSGIIGALLLGFVYMGFGVVAAFCSDKLAGVVRSDVFSIVAKVVLGPSGGLFANVTIAIACLTTAIALTTVFATYVYEEFLIGKANYLVALIGTILIAFGLANTGFDAIMVFGGAALTVLYPALIVLVVANTAKVFFGFRWVRLPVFATFAATVWIQYAPLLRQYGVTKIGLMSWF